MFSISQLKLVAGAAVAVGAIVWIDLLRAEVGRLEADARVIADRTALVVAQRDHEIGTLRGANAACAADVEAARVSTQKWYDDAARWSRAASDAVAAASRQAQPRIAQAERLALANRDTGDACAAVMALIDQAWAAGQTP